MANGGAAKFSSSRKKTWMPARMVDAKAVSLTSTLWRARSTKPYAESRNAHSRSEPSWPLQSAENLYIGFRSRLVWCRM
jgi:hypothetical protein